MLALGCAGGLYISIASGSRGGWIALPAVMAVFLAAFLTQKNIKHVAAALLLLTISMGAVLLTVPAIGQRYDQAVSDIQQYQAGNPKTSLGMRFAMYESLLQLIPQKPLLGWSEHDYAAAQQKLVAERRASPTILKLANTHNTYLEYWVFQGIFALLLVLALLAASFVYFCRRLRAPDPRTQAAAVCGASLAVLWAMAKPRPCLRTPIEP